MKVPFLELRPAYEELRTELDEAYHRVMNSGWYLLGKEIEIVEAEFAAYCEAKYCIRAYPETAGWPDGTARNHVVRDGAVFQASRVRSPLGRSGKGRRAHDSGY